MMSKELRASIVQLVQVLELELNDSKQLEGGQQKAIRQMLGFDDTGCIYYSSTGIVFTRAVDYDKAKLVFHKCTELAMAHASDYSVFLGALCYINCPELVELLDEPTAETD